MKAPAVDQLSWAFQTRVHNYCKVLEVVSNNSIFLLQKKEFRHKNKLKIFEPQYQQMGYRQGKST